MVAVVVTAIYRLGAGFVGVFVSSHNNTTKIRDLFCHVAEHIVYVVVGWRVVNSSVTIIVSLRCSPVCCCGVKLGVDTLRTRLIVCGRHPFVKG